ncbi:MAG: hypothetical protein CSA22_06425 [Deltaproteobacteria bacterium]|nr:MAG: hypothetical protein CSA22_06425 [Deltaproteobacteria bacterium]
MRVLPGAVPDADVEREGIIRPEFVHGDLLFPQHPACYGHGIDTDLDASPVPVEPVEKPAL